MTEEDLLKQQMITTMVYIICLFVSLSLTYDEYLKRNNNKLFDNKTSTRIATINRIIILILTLSYLYINFSNREIAKSNNSDLKFFNLQLNASFLSLISAIIVLYVVVKSGDYPIVSSSENPEI